MTASPKAITRPDSSSTSDSPTAADDHAAVWLFPPILPLSTLVLGIGLQFVLPLGKSFAWLPPWVRFTIAPLFFVGGVAFLVGGGRALARMNTNVDPRQPTLRLVEIWPFTMSRNPMYAGGSAMLIGIALGFQLYWVLVLYLLSLPILYFGVVLKEERYLERKFGRDYLSYQARVRRWL